MIKLAPSILSADFANLARDVDMIRQAGAHFVHVDVMDGHFVPNLTIGAPVVKALRRATPMPLDVHLMITDPDRYLDDFLAAGSSFITVHYESNGSVESQIRKIREKGARPSVSVKPKTPADVLFPLLPMLDMVLVMSVEPGFGGQSFIPETIEKIKALRAEIDRQGAPCLLEVDGGVTLLNAKEIAEAGADVLVAGSAVFGAEDPAAAVRAFCAIDTGRR